jgi:gas vesicle protein
MCHDGGWRNPLGGDGIHWTCAVKAFYPSRAHKCCWLQFCCGVSLAELFLAAGAHGSIEFGRRIFFDQETEEIRRTVMSDNESGVSGFGWFLAGLGVGALVGVLYAPKSGKDTRDDLLSASLEAKDKAAALAQQGREKAADLAAQGKQQANEYVDRGREYYEKGRSQWSDYVEKGKDALSDQQEKLTAAVDAGKETYADVANKS